MDRADRLVAAEHHHQTGDLPPAAKMDDVAAIAAGIGARRGFEKRGRTVIGEQGCGVFDGASIGEVELFIHCWGATPGGVRGEWIGRTPALAPKTFASAREIGERAIRDVRRDSGPRRCHRPGMTDTVRKASLGGGVFLGLGPIAGLIIGTLLGEPSIGLVAGLVLGGATALLIWLLRR